MAEPKPSSFPKIRGALRFYKITSIITGVMLLLLIAEMVLKYSPIHVELFYGGSRPGLHFADVIVGDTCKPWSKPLISIDDCKMTSVGDGVNISLLILISHGWFYVVYLFSCFNLWSKMRWRLGRFVSMAAAGVIPFWSFIMEHRVSREVEEYLAHREAEQTAIENVERAV